ncbi:MAG: hypothetical protein KUF82_20870, partial [Candidatus Thiodiazotropha sp. (ex Ctena orbiculata)]|nr:hypothetical protein [Candidatus Thiodiazotropha taylori]
PIIYTICIMAEGGEDPKVDLKTFWPDKDVEFMVEMLRATGRYEVVPLDIENVSGPDNYGHVPATSTPLSGKGDSVPSEFSLLGHTYRKVPPPVPKRESSHLIVHRTTSAEPPKSPTLKPPRPPPPKDYPFNPHVHFQEEVESIPPVNSVKKDSTSVFSPYVKPEPGSEPPKVSSTPSFSGHPPPSFNTTLNSSYLASMRLPQLPFFSGEDQKGDVSFEVWKFELSCLIRENYPDSLVLQSIRKNLRGKAREILLTLGETAKPSDILNKLEGIYGNVSTSEVLLQQFYIQSQGADESVADYSIRIENLLRRAVRNRSITDTVRNEMLCSKLWNGLRDPLLKNSTRYTYETEKDFNELRKKIRAVEQDLTVSSATAQTSSLSSSSSPATDLSDIKNIKQLQQSISDSNSTNQKLDGLLQQMKLLRERMDGLENKFKDATVKSGTSSTTTVPTSAPSQRGFTLRGRGGSYRGSYNFRRGQYRQRGAFQQQQQPASDTKTETKSSSGSDKKADGSLNPLN